MKISHAFIGLSVLLAACNSSTKKTPDGLEFQVLKSGDGQLPATGQLIVYDFKMVDSKDSVWFNTYEGFPEVTAIGDSAQQASEDNFLQMLRMLSKGDSVTFKTTVGEFFSQFVRTPVPAEVDSTLDLSYYVSVEEILNRDDFAQFRDEAIKKYNAAQLAKDTAAIDKHLAEQGIKAETTPSGLRYVVTKKGNGPNVGSGQTAKIQYSGYLLDGTFFDSSEKSVAEEKGIYDPRREPYEPIEVTVDQSRVISGWHEAIKLLNEGAKATVYIPSTLGYGQQRRSNVIVENSILVFDLEVVDVE